jgi:hypothetical protein
MVLKYAVLPGAVLRLGIGALSVKLNRGSAKMLEFPLM